MYKYLPAIAILLLCIWNSRELLWGWQSMQEVGGALAFVFWVLPVVDFWVIRRLKMEPNQILLIMALVVSVIGTLGSVNTIHYISLGLAIAAFLPFSWIELPWLLCMIVWMPAFGWISLKFFPDHRQIVRCILGLLGGLWMLILLRKKRTEI